jgi:hypothetical protein
MEIDGHRTDRGHSVDGTRAYERKLSLHEARLMFHLEDKQSGSSHPSNDEDEKPHRNDDNQKGAPTSRSAFRKHPGGLWSTVKPDFKWVPQNSTWSKWKPVIRCALAAWICGLLFIIPNTENAMGQVSPSVCTRPSETYKEFVGQLLNSYRLVRQPVMSISCADTHHPQASFLSPPSDPFMAVLERELLMLLFSAITWA